MPEMIPVKGIRKTIAERMTESWHISPRVAYRASVDVSRMQEFRDKWNEDHREKGLKISVNHILMKACAVTLMEYPYVNSSFDGKNIILHEHANVGLAVALDNGLIVPNMKNVETSSLEDISLTVSNLVEKTRKMKITMDDVTGGTFTVTNLGSFGMEEFSPIINQPEVAILGVGKTVMTPWVEGNEILIKPIIKITLVADHRVVDGAMAAQFLKSLQDHLETMDFV